MAKVILGVFNDRDNVEDAIERLETRGFNPKDVSIVMRDQEQADEIVHETGADNVVANTVTGASTGAILGGLAGLLASFVIPGLGAFFIGGPIAAALGLGGAAAVTASGAITGAAAGGLIGLLSGAFGLSESEARVYESQINAGAILLAVPTQDEDVDYVVGIFEGYNAQNIKTIDATDEGFARRSQHRIRTDADYDEEPVSEERNRRAPIRHHTHA